MKMLVLSSIGLTAHFLFSAFVWIWAARETSPRRVTAGLWLVMIVIFLCYWGSLFGLARSFTIAVGESL